MIKNDIVDELYRMLGGINKKDISQYVDNILEIMVQALVKDESMKIARFGAFETRHKNARIGRNPKTLEEVIINARRVVTFRISDQVLKRLNSPEADSAIAVRKKALEDSEHDET